MVKKVDVIYSGTKIKHNGAFDLSLLYQNMREWFMFMGYGDPATKEIKYEEKMKPNGKTVNFHWKVSQDKEDGYFLLVIDIEFGLTRLNDTKIEHNGSMITVDKGDIEIVINASVVRDSDGKWKGKMTQDLYDKYISNIRREEVIQDLDDDVSDFITELKAFLGLYQF